MNDLRSRRSVAETFASLLSANLVLAGIGFFTSIALASTLGAARYGDLAYAMAVGGYVLTFAYCGLDRSLIRDLIHRPERSEALVSASILLRGSLLVAGLCGLLLVERGLGLVNPLGADGWMIVAALAIPAMNLAPVFDAWGRIRLHTVFQVVERGGYFAFIWAFLVFAPRLVEVRTVAMGLMLGSVIGLGLQYRSIFNRIGARWGRQIVRVAASLIRRNSWLWISALAQLSFGGLSKIVLGNEAGSAELGAYAIAWQVVTVGSLFTAQIGRIGNPGLVATTRSGASRRERLRFLVRYLAIASATACLIAVPALMAPSFLLSLVGPEFPTAAPAMRVLAVYMIMVAAGTVGVQYLVAARLERVFGITLMATALLSVGLLAVLVPPMGSLGAALAVSISHGLALVVYLGVAVTHATRSGDVRD